MRIGSGENSYEWVDNWAKIPDVEGARTGWAHHGIVVTEAGDVIAHHPGDPTVLVFDEGGNIKGSWDTGLTESHGMTLVKEGDAEYLWIADNGQKAVKEDGYVYGYQREPRLGQILGQAVKKTLDGRTVMVLPRPGLPIYQEGDYKPTKVAVNEERYGGNGDIWVSDGYAQYYVHRYDKHGNYISSINGEEGAGSFSVNHGIWVDTRRSEPELYIGDEGNQRIQVYDLDGKFKRSFGTDVLSMPSGLVTQGDLLIVLELCARLSLFDGDDNFICYLGDNKEVFGTEAWPNMKDRNGEIVRSGRLQPGRFNSPHGIAVDGDGNVYVAEWLIGGRITKLAKV